jgi:hypothetical protein
MFGEGVDLAIMIPAPASRANRSSRAASRLWLRRPATTVGPESAWGWRCSRSCGRAAPRPMPPPRRAPAYAGPTPSTAALRDDGCRFSLPQRLRLIPVQLSRISPWTGRASGDPVQRVTTVDGVEPDEDTDEGHDLVAPARSGGEVGRGCRRRSPRRRRRALGSSTWWLAGGRASWPGDPPLPTCDANIGARTAVCGSDRSTEMGGRENGGAAG